MVHRPAPAELSQTFLRAESLYFDDWKKDSEIWMQDGLYARVAEIANPQSGRIVLDMGTGTGMQLVFLAGENPDGLFIGTDRTPANVLLAVNHLRSKGLDAISALTTQELSIDDQQRLYWQQRSVEELRTLSTQVRNVLRQHVLIMDDDMRHPIALPIILDGEKVDTAILSLPGGGPTRAYEWPHAPNADPAQADARSLAVSNDARSGFYHYASQAVRDGGKAIIVERVVSGVDAADPAGVLTLIGRHAGVCGKYWNARKVHTRAMPTNFSVELRATLGTEQISHAAIERRSAAMHLAIIELCRNTVPFNEAPRPRPAT